MTNPTPRTVPISPEERLPRRVVLGGYSIQAEGDGPEAGTGLRVLDLDPERSADAAPGAEAAGPGADAAPGTGTGADRVPGAGTGADPAPEAGTRADPVPEAGEGVGTDDPYTVVGHESLVSPTWVVAHPRHPWLVSVGEVAPAELVCSRLEDDGRLTVLSRWATTGDFGCHLLLGEDGRQVVVAHYGSGTVESFGLDEEGRFIGPLGRYVSDAPLGPDAERQDGPHAHQVVIDPERDELLVCDLGTDRVHRLRIEPDGRLGEVAPDVELPPGSGPRHLVLAGDTMIVACELSVELWVARRDRDGWSHTQTVATTGRTAEERARSSAPVLPSEIRIADDHVVVATRGVDTVSVFGLDRERSAVSFAAEVSCGGQHPRDLVVADGRIWVANQWSNEVVVLDLAAVVAGDEAPPLATIASPRPACVVLAGAPAGL